ncbi:epoxyqueuosine reductase [Peptococcaceae bacterium CEB3]|nr:epoxyqueuosine reductase [Peptococcaceae bacterium CEB3]
MRMGRQVQSSLDNLDSVDLMEQLKGWGAEIVGIGDVRLGLPSDLKGLSTAISLGLIHPEQSPKEENQFYEYRYPEIDLRIEYIQKMMTRQLHANGWRFLAIPSDTSRRENRLISKIYPLFPHKTAATCSGLGWIGKSGLLVHPQYGPRVSWATVLTNAPYRATGKPYIRGQCGQCNACVRACPAGAISGQEWRRGSNYETMVDIVSCAQQLELNRAVVGDLACGRCIEACWRGHRS